MHHIYPYTMYFASRTNTFVLFGHRSFTQGSQQSEKITNLNVEEEEERKDEPSRYEISRVRIILGMKRLGYETSVRYQNGIMEMQSLQKWHPCSCPDAQKLHGQLTLHFILLIGTISKNWQEICWKTRSVSEAAMLACLSVTTILVGRL